MKKTMQIFTVVGPLGTGKTTFVLNVIQVLESRGFKTREKVAYVVNDEGSLVDGQLAGKSAEVVAMTNGCFTCSDTAELKVTLERLEQSGIAWVFLEGFGITAGNETRKFLESCPYPFHILCLLSAKHHALDLVRYADVVKSQVRTATIAVGVTKHDGGSIFDLDASGIPEFVAKANHGLPIVLVPNGFDIPSIVFDIFENKGEKMIRRITPSAKRVHHHGHEHGTGCCSCGHNYHNHVSHETHVHGMYPYSYDLRQEATLDDLRKAFNGKDFMLRIKGAVGGRLFNEVHGDWTETVDDPRRFVTFYASKEVDIEDDLPELATLVTIGEESVDEGQGYQLLRKETATRDESVEAIQLLLKKIPHKAIVLSSDKGLRIITHPEELQLVKEIARRPYVRDEWFPHVIKRCMEYWIKCAEMVRDLKGEIVPHELATNQRELAVYMTWWVNRYGDFFGPEIVSVVKSLRPGTMAIKGIISLESLNSDPERASWQCQEFTEALSYCLKHDGCVELVLSAAAHCLSLARTAELRKAWAENLEKLTEEARMSFQD